MVVYGRRRWLAGGRMNARLATMTKTSSRGARRLAGCLSRRLNALGLFLLFAVLVVFMGPAGAGAQEEEPPAPSKTSVWYAASSSLVRVDAQSGQAAGSVKLPSGIRSAQGLASHPTDGSVAVLAAGRLLGFDGSGTKTFEEVLGAASSLGKAPVLASDPHDGSLWVGGVGVLVLADSKGQNQRQVNLGSQETVTAISPSQDGGTWVLTPSRLLRFSKDGQKLSERKMPEGGLSSPYRLAVDELGEFAYLANKTEVAQLDLKKDADPPIRKLTPKGGVGALAVNPFDGTLYVSSRPTAKKPKGILYSYDEQSGNLLKQGAFKAKAVRSLSFDAPSQTLWLGTSSRALGFQKDLNPKTTIAASGLSALSAAPLSLSSRVSLFEPSNGSATKDTRQPIKLTLKAYCNNERCPEGLNYGKGFRLELTLNGQNVSEDLPLEGDPLAQGGAQATYTPTQDLTEGKKELVAQAEDQFGVRSNRLEASFTVDATAPRFLDVKPEDGTVLEEDRATITGKVDDPKARVYLEGLTFRTR